MVDDKTKNANKYGDVESLVEFDSTVTDVPKRIKKPRRLPAVDAMQGESQISNVTDMLRKEKEVAENKLEVANNEKLRAQEENVLYKQQNESLQVELEKNASEKSEVGQPNIMVMPITKEEVIFKLQRIDPALIDVSPENERIQEFLDEISLQDIIPSLKLHGQQKPGTLRPRPNGRYELIEGSRRLASVKTIEGMDYLALVGNVPDADVRELALIENKHKDVSWFEKAKAFQRQIENGEYKTWNQLGAAKGISDSHINRYKACVSLDELFIRILPSPSDMTLTYGEMISKLMKKDSKSLLSKAKEILKVRTEALSDAEVLLETKDILQLLKSSVRTKKNKPTVNSTILYKSEDGTVSLKHGLTNKGGQKFEINGASVEQIEKVLGFISEKLKVTTQKTK